MWGGLGITVLTAFIITLLVSPQRPAIKYTKAFLFFILSLLFILILNLYWIYPYVVSYKYNYTHRLKAAGGYAGAISWSQEISRNANFTNLFKLQGIPDWYDNPNHPYSNTLLSNYFFIFLAILFPTLAFVSLVNIKDSDRLTSIYKLVFLGILLVAIPFTAGSHPPTGVLYNLALKYLPGFLIFRTPFYKFGMALWFAYSYLIAIGLKYVVAFVKQRISPLATLVTFTIFLGIYTYPVFTGSFFNWSNKYSTKIKVPNYIFEAKHELDTNAFSTRTLMAPALDNGSKYISYDWKYFSLSSIPSILSRRPIILNDAVLSDSESGLVNAIYQQLAKSSSSPLLKFTGVDRAIVQDDFKVDEYIDYFSHPTKSAISGITGATLYKQAGKWNFFTLPNPETIPLIYIPESFTYILAETSHLAQASQFPVASSLADALVFKHISENNTIDLVSSRDKVQNLVIQAQCQNCEVKKPIEIRSTPPLLSPDNPFYFILEYVYQNIEKKYRLPTEKIDFTLGTMSKEVSGVDTIISKQKKDSTLDYIFSKWSNNVYNINTYFSQIEPPDHKAEYTRRISLYYWNLLVSIQKWRQYDLADSVLYKLDILEDLLSSSAQKLPQAPAFEYDHKSNIFSVQVPFPGIYKLAVYNPKPNDTDTLSGLINDASYTFKKLSLHDKWYVADSAQLDQSQQTIVLPELTTKKNSIQVLSLVHRPASPPAKP